MHALRPLAVRYAVWRLVIAFGLQLSLVRAVRCQQFSLVRIHFCIVAQHQFPELRRVKGLNPARLAVVAAWRAIEKPPVHVAFRANILSRIAICVPESKPALRIGERRG